MWGLPSARGPTAHARVSSRAERSCRPLPDARANEARSEGEGGLSSSSQKGRNVGLGGGAEPRPVGLASAGDGGSQGSRALWASTPRGLLSKRPGLNPGPRCPWAAASPSLRDLVRGRAPSPPVPKHVTGPKGRRARLVGSIQGLRAGSGLGRRETPHPAGGGRCHTMTLSLPHPTDKSDPLPSPHSPRTAHPVSPASGGSSGAPSPKGVCWPWGGGEAAGWSRVSLVGRTTSSARCLPEGSRTPTSPGTPRTSAAAGAPACTGANGAAGCSHGQLATHPSRLPPFRVQCPAGHPPAQPWPPLQGRGLLGACDFSPGVSVWPWGGDDTGESLVLRGELPSWLGPRRRACCHPSGPPLAGVQSLGPGRPALGPAAPSAGPGGTFSKGADWFGLGDWQAGQVLVPRGHSLTSQTAASPRSPWAILCAQEQSGWVPCDPQSDPVQQWAPRRGCLEP